MLPLFFISFLRVSSPIIIMALIGFGIPEEARCFTFAIDTGIFHLGSHFYSDGGKIQASFGVFFY